MTLKNTIKKMLLEYPTLYQDRAQCLNQLFCVNGNGYEWIKGQLVDEYQDHRYKRDKEVDIALQEGFDILIDSIVYNNSDTSLSIPQYVQRSLLEKYRQQRALANLDKIIQPGFHQFIQAGYEFYPLCEYAKIMNLPTDIKQDWLDGAKETLQLLNQYSFNSDDNKQTKKFMKILNNDKRLK